MTNPNDEPLKHIRRVSLPWRSEELVLTECGRVAANHPSVSVDEAKESVKKLGERRTSFLFCVTCLDACRRSAWRAERTDALFAAIEREVDRANTRQPDEQFVRELHAIALLVDAHRAEFDMILADMTEATDIRTIQKKPSAAPKFHGLKL